MRPESSELSSKVSFLFLLIGGFCMGAADLVPGISGGTIAFLMGFYRPFLESLKSLDRQALYLLVTCQFHLFFKRLAWPFLLPLLTGIAVAFVSLAHLFHWILQHEVYRTYLYASFIGFILASFVLCTRQIARWSFRSTLGLALGIVLAYLGTTWNLEEKAASSSYTVEMHLEVPHFAANYDRSLSRLKDLSSATVGALVAKGDLSPQAAVYDEQGNLVGAAGQFTHLKVSKKIDGWLILCGLLAISAMLLPGISGSYLLSILGVYPVAIGALADLTAGLGRAFFDWEAFTILANLGLGILVGLALFSRFVSWLLKAYPNEATATLSGCMIGALPSVWPFWSYKYELMPLKLVKGPQLIPVRPMWPNWASSLVWEAFICMLLGCAIVFFIEWVAHLKQSRSSYRIKPVVRINREREL